MSVHSDFRSRHLGAIGSELDEMLEAIGYDSLDALIDEAVPAGIRSAKPLDLPAARSEPEALAWLKSVMGKNRVLKSFIGQGYYGTHVPAVIQRNILENPGWYTAYTPYQAEIAQGRLEALLNFQTLITELSGLDVANASLLDEGTAAAEAMSLALTGAPKGRVIFVSDACHPQTIDVVKTRAEPLGIQVELGDWKTFEPSACDGFFAALVQYPDTQGSVDDYSAFFAKVKEAKGTAIVAADLLALTLLKPPGEFGADICIGSSQRFGVPMEFGGPHAGFMACTDKLKRKLPGRLIGVSIDSRGRPGFRLALQTREQHIRRDKATSNICTAQVLLAVMASMYAVYHGPEGLKAIASTVRQKTAALASVLSSGGVKVKGESFFDTLTIEVANADEVIKTGIEAGINLRRIDDGAVGVSIDETSVIEDLATVAGVLGVETSADALAGAFVEAQPSWDASLSRQSAFLKQQAFNSYHTETEMLRYMKRLESKDLALNESMIPLGSCTMKLNATSEMMPLSWNEVANLHPFVPADQSEGYREMLKLLED